VRFLRRRILQAGLIGLFVAGAVAKPQSVWAADGDGRATAVSALDKLDAWLGPESNGDRWRAYLHEDELRAELAKGAEGDPAIVARQLQRFQGDAKGLELAPFVTAREAIGKWLGELKRAYAADLSKLAWASRGDHTPISPAQFDEVRADLRTKARALEAALARTPQGAKAWTTYLLLDRLQPVLADDFRPTSESLADLDEVLRRFHANQPGLELPVFTNVAKAIARYRSLATWAATARVRDSRPLYERYLTDLAKLLERHRERGTVETTRQVARALGVVDSLGQSPDFVKTARSAYAHSNVFGAVSTAFITRAPNRPVDRITPVRDCILGTSIFGSAHTLGGVKYVVENSADSIQLAIYFSGEAHSRTRGFHKPVQVNSTGVTTFWATKTVALTDDQFISTPAVADASTHTQIHSIQKTGGQFAHRLIEKIAWKRAAEQKGQAEAVSSAHTRERVLREFEEIVVHDLAAARVQYDAKIRAPLVRRGASPEYLQMTSAAQGVSLETLFATRSQLGASGPPPRMMPGHDLAVQIHESAINNYLPLALASARIAQQTADHPPDLKGNVPNWLKLMSVGRPNLAAAASAGAEIVDEAKQRVKDAVGVEPNVTPPPFKPYSITLNADAPATVHFDDGKIEIRVRAAVLASDESEYKNWDFIVTYQITQNGDRILLKRVGEIEAFPTGFDVEWPRQLSAEETGFRSVLKKNMNARANAGQSFPKEIPIEPVRLSRFGVLVLRELVADDGWLTVGWGLPSLGATAGAPSPPVSVAR
jgi:hypothetical protein